MISYACCLVSMWNVVDWYVLFGVGINIYSSRYLYVSLYLSKCWWLTDWVETLAMMRYSCLERWQWNEINVLNVMIVMCVTTCRVRCPRRVNSAPYLKHWYCVFNTNRGYLALQRCTQWPLTWDWGGVLRIPLPGPMGSGRLEETAGGVLSFLGFVLRRRP